jgi:hypothetical protein
MTGASGDRAKALAARYRDAARAWGASLEAGSSDAANKQFDECVSMYRELKRLGPDAVGALLPFLDSDEASVALAAASVLLEFYPVEASAVLHQLSGLKGLRGFSAKMTLREWEAGRMEFPEA